MKPASGGDVVEYQLTRQSFKLSQPENSIPVLDQYQSGLLSGLVLAGANLPPEPNRDDGIITALEVAALDLQRVDLAVLSACETGLGQSAGGEGMLGLQRAFQSAGAQTTVSSLWSVDDAATQTMMTEFYKRLWDKEHPLGKLEALRQAQLEMLHHYDPRRKKTSRSRPWKRTRLGRRTTTDACRQDTGPPLNLAAIGGSGSMRSTVLQSRKKALASNAF